MRTTNTSSPTDAVNRTAMAYWQRPSLRAWVWQVLAMVLLGSALWWVASNIALNLPRLGMVLQFDFFSRIASFEIGDNLVGFQAGDSFTRAFAAGIANTLQVSVLGMVLTALLGAAVALLRLTNNLLVSRLAWLYIEIARNLPLLLQLIFWQILLVRLLPPPRMAWQPLQGVAVSNRGASFTSIAWQSSFTWALLLMLLLIGAAAAYKRWVAQPSGRTNLLLLAACLLLPTLLLVLASQPLAVSRPELRGFNWAGGVTLVPEFFTLLFGLVFCHAAFAAESIRAGILGVRRGQWNAAFSVGLTRLQCLRAVVMPQALRIMVPPLTSNFLSLTKSSSLAVAIGYPDLMRVTSVAISETGRAVECITITLLIYLSLSLATSALMNAFNRRVALRGG